MKTEYNVIFTGLQVTRTLTRRVVIKGEHGDGFTTENCGHELVVYNVAVDMAGLQNMAIQAARSKGQKSRDGALLVEVVRKTRL